jgi:hypothetical protein
VALPEERSIPLDKFPPKARRFLSEDAPSRLKTMVASGLVPLKPVVQLCALYQISIQEGGTLASLAAQSIRRLPPATLSQALSQPIIPLVLDWLADLLDSDENLIRVILLNKVTDDVTVTRIAMGANQATCDLIAQNQIRLVRWPALVEALFFNSNARASTVDRMLDFAARNRLVLPNIPEYEAVVAEVLKDLPDTPEAAAAADEAFRAAQDALDELTGTSKTDAELDKLASEISEGPRSARDFKTEKEPEEDTSNRQSAAGRIRDLNVAQKVRLALMGTSAERGILIRDTNKVVARTVIRSPAVTDSEALLYSKNKSLLDEVVSFIASNKKWTRHYRMKLNLVMNPKCPTADAMRFLSHLRLSDLRIVARSRDVPGPVTKAAKNLLKTRIG